MTQHTKTIEQTYKVLSEIEHVRARVGMYAGSPVIESRDEFVYDVAANKMIKSSVSFVPALVKIISEIIDNVVDEHKRNPNVVDQLKLDITDDGEITVVDNGGIPVVMHKEFAKYVPEIIFGTLRSGSNYNDNEDQSVIGTNGLGAKLTVILSDYFIIETADGAKSFKQEFTEGMHKRSDPKIKDSTRNYTKIVFKPDYKFFGLNCIDKDHIHKIVRRLVDVAGCNAKLKVSFNGERLTVKSFEDYIKLYADEYVYDDSNTWKIGITHSDGFEQTSFVNAVETYMGGTHVEYVTNQLLTSLREHFKKKHKIDVKPSDIKNHIHMFISCDVVRPKFSSQTKENMISAPNTYGTSYTMSDKVVRKVVNSPVIQAVLDWVEAKEQAQLLASMRKLNKTSDKANIKKIKKFHDATEKDRAKTYLFLCEGDSAQSSILGARDPSLHGTFPLRGRPINVSAATFDKIKDNAEFENIRTIIGLKYGESVTAADMNFGHIVIASDADAFGNSIAGLIINMFYRLWPDVIKGGHLYRLMTPVVIVEHKKQTLEFFNESDFINWRSANDGERYTYKFLKGLGSSNPKQFKTYMNDLDKYLIKYTYDQVVDDAALDLCFSKEDGFTDQRKLWLDLE